MEIKSQITGIILAGGASRRMGHDKALLKLNGRPLIQYVAELLDSISAELLIVGDHEERYKRFGYPVVEDYFRGIGPLGGLHAGLRAASHDLVLAVGCDMPFLNTDLLCAFAHWADGFDGAILRHPNGKYLEPLHAVYRRTCVSRLEENILSGERKMSVFLSHIHMQYITPMQIAPFDPNMRSFYNVNTLKEWETARYLSHAQNSDPKPERRNCVLGKQGEFQSNVPCAWSPLRSVWGFRPKLPN